ncbi:MOSC domain-containing protein [Ruegeria atlantica]|uniref:MOSC domain protein n=1 Tax=Ruegeria atlantica TaxID=81569 RepID=A0A0P1EH77_9RHOB|nr:MOSC domain-containing protein [Ruegeria atlantica]CUH49282.1 MOSC domain protein [Ruegeria atlantica]
MSLSVLISNWCKPGRIGWIGLRPERRAEMFAVEEGMISTNGLDGDRGRAGKRAVTLIQQEHLVAIGSYLGQGPVNPDILRRNLVVSGINLAALKGREVQVGEAVLRFTIICAPCSRMEEALGKGGYSAVRGHGGWCAEMMRPGQVTLGDEVRPID